jgi:DNA-binding NarL/FixJ family response regulator
MSSTSVAASNTIAVLLADSNQMRRQLLVGALRRRPEFVVTSCDLETEAILNAVTSSAVQVAVLTAADQSHDSWRELTIVRRLHQAHPAVAKVLLVDFYDRDLVVNAFRSGARGLFCVTEHAFRLLCRCIHCVHDGQVWANNEQMQYLIEVLAQVPSLRVVNTNGLKLLTPREEQVVALVADGLSNREVARELGLSEHTVKKYVFRIFDKLGISSRVELVLYAVSHGGTRQAEWMAGFRA